MHWRGLRITICLNLHHSSLKAKRDLLDPWFLPWGKVRVCEWAPISPSVQGAATQANFSLTPSRLLNYELHDWWWKGWGENLEDCQTGFSEDMKEIWILQIASQALSGSPSTSYRGLPPTSPWATPAFHMPHPHTPPFSGWLPVSSLYSSCKSELWQMVSEYMLKVGLHLWARERPQTWTLARPLRKWKGGYQHSAWWFAVSIACIQA